jgi:hypothetical protein
MATPTTKSKTSGNTVITWYRARLKHTIASTRTLQAGAAVMVARSPIDPTCWIVADREGTWVGYSAQGAAYYCETIRIDGKPVVCAQTNMEGYNPCKEHGHTLGPNTSGRSSGTATQCLVCGENQSWDSSG